MQKCVSIYLSLFSCIDFCAEARTCDSNSPGRKFGSVTKTTLKFRASFQFLMLEKRL